MLPLVLTLRATFKKRINVHKMISALVGFISRFVLLSLVSYRDLLQVFHLNLDTHVMLALDLYCSLWFQI